MMNLRSWLSSLNSSRRRNRKSTRTTKLRAASRPPFLEPLEARRLLAAVPLNLASVLTEDIIVNRANGVTDTSQSSMDRSNWAYMTQSYASYLGGSAGPGMPDDGLIAATAFHPEIQLPYNNANYGNNGRVIRSSTGSFTFGVPQDNYNFIHIAGASTEGSSNFRLTLTYTTGSSVTTPLRTMPDWYNEISQSADQYYLLDSMDRADYRGNRIFENSNDPAVFGFRFATDPTRVLSSVTVEKTSSAGYFVFFGAYGDNTNIGPKLTVDSSTVTVPEGQTATNRGAVSDLDGDVVSMSASIGSVVNNGDGTWNWAQTTTDGPQSQTVTVSATDDRGAVTNRTFQLNVTNVNVSYDAGPDETLSPSAAGAFSRGPIRFADPGADVWSGTVNYGEPGGVNEPLSINQLNKTFSLNHTYAREGVWPVTVTLRDDDGASVVDRFYVTLSLNSPPVVRADLAAVSADEGGTVSNTGTFADQDGGPVTLSASIGTVVQNTVNGTWSWTLDAADGPAGGNVTITARDAQNAAATATFSYSIDNVAPTISLSGNATVDEGSPYTLHLGAVTDPGQDTIQSYIIDWGDGTTSGVLTGDPAYTTATHVFADGPATRTNKVTVTDEDGNFLAGELNVLVLDVSPTIALSGDEAVDEGSPYTLNLGAIADPGDDTVTAYSIDWGDGSDVENFTGSPANLTQTHTYADGTAYPVIRVSLFDEDGGHRDAATILVAVDNVAPTIALSGDEAVDEGSSYTLNLGAIADPGDDTVTAYSIDWGDGSDVETYTGDPADLTHSHIYADGTAFYTIRVSLTDEDGDHADAGSFLVRVDNVAPTTPSDDDAAADEVVENAAGGTLVGITAKSADVGPLDTITFRLTDDAGGRFTIDANTGVVTVADGAVLDYETAASHTVTVEANDGEHASFQDFTINLLNVQAVVSGTVFVDVNGNGLFDGGSETALNGVKVKLLDSALTELAEDVTELGGVYAFTVDDEFGTYVIREIQPTGVTDGAAILGSAAVDSVLSANEMQLTLAGADASDYDFTEVGQNVQSGDTATIGFWQNKNGQALIQKAGAALVPWLNDNFSNVFGTRFSDGVGGDNPAEVAAFYKSEFFDKKLKGTSKVDAQFMSLALATFFTSSNLSGGSVAVSYGFQVTETGIGTKVVNVGSSGVAFGVADNTNMTILALLQATNRLTGADANGDGYSNAYDTDGDGTLSDGEKALRALANTIYSSINENGDI